VNAESSPDCRWRRGPAEGIDRLGATGEVDELAYLALDSAWTSRHTTTTTTTTTIAGRHGLAGDGGQGLR